MRASVPLPDQVVHELESLARHEGITLSDLLTRIVTAHLASCAPRISKRGSMPLPCIPATETGLIQPISGQDLDELLARDYFSA